MTFQIDPTNDKVLNTFNQYHDILLIRYSDSSKERNLDHLAATLTMSHFMDHIVCKLKDMENVFKTMADDIYVNEDGSQGDLLPEE